MSMSGKGFQRLFSTTVVRGHFKLRPIPGPGTPYAARSPQKKKQNNNNKTWQLNCFLKGTNMQSED